MRIALLALCLSAPAFAQDDHRDADRRAHSATSGSVDFSVFARSDQILQFRSIQQNPTITITSASKTVLVLKPNGEVWINGEKMRSNREFYFKFKRLLNGQCP